MKRAVNGEAGSVPAGLFVDSAAVHAREVTLLDGSKHALHFRELSRKQFRAYYQGQEADDDDRKDEATAAFIAASLCEPDGTPAMDTARAATLKPVASNAIVAAILEVNGFRVSEKNS